MKNQAFLISSVLVTIDFISLKVVILRSFSAFRELENAK